jgi:acyl-coenzyme A synthetase/AMP-(fatty) acid ligase
LADTVILPSRRRIPSVSVEVLIRTVENVKRFQIVQRPNKDIIVKVVVDNKKMQERIRREIIRRVKLACLNEDVDIQVRFVERILPQDSGKIPQFIREAS